MKAPGPMHSLHPALHGRWAAPSTAGRDCPKSFGSPQEDGSRRRWRSSDDESKQFCGRTKSFGLLHADALLHHPALFSASTSITDCLIGIISSASPWRISTGAVI